MLGYLTYFLPRNGGDLALMDLALICIVCTLLPLILLFASSLLWHNLYFSIIIYHSNFSINVYHDYIRSAHLAGYLRGNRYAGEVNVIIRIIIGISNNYNLVLLLLSSYYCYLVLLLLSLIFIFIYHSPLSRCY